MNTSLKSSTQLNEERRAKCKLLLFQHFANLSTEEQDYLIVELKKINEETKQMMMFYQYLEKRVPAVQEMSAEMHELFETASI
ncbi:hypothetical protein ACFSKU_17310 [Pontibacter silvestris]|uniref:Uncharacterized protein n=1 Tax=Pontibacter silvestris TaxID=2305183 RepID=A0ABW4X225_9BACT|nr:hypothetical protein [Pontibacter silvestris]MCC9135782.1 hypothetical protein [Pontibacter silvestris]